MSLTWTTVLTVPIGLILASAFSAIMAYAQGLMPSRVGMVAGLFFGFAFGRGGAGAAVLGWLADRTGIGSVYRVCAFLPLVGLPTAFLPDLLRPGRGLDAAGIINRDQPRPPTSATQNSRKVPILCERINPACS